jgi:hypothetical protein
VTSTRKFSEKELINLLQKKNREAYVYLYDKYAPALYGVILKQVKNEKIAANVLSKGFQKIWHECDTVNCIKQSVFIWMYSLMYKEIKAVTVSINGEEKAEYDQLVV